MNERMELYTLRLPQTVIQQFEERAERQHLPIRTLMRSWIMQRLDEEEVNEGSN